MAIFYIMLQNINIYVREIIFLYFYSQYYLKQVLKNYTT